MHSPRSRHGDLVTIVVLAAIPSIIAVGLAVDVLRADAVQSDLRRAVEAAALAAARATLGEPTNHLAADAAARLSFFAAYRGVSRASLVDGGPTVAAGASAAGGIDVAADADVPMTFSRLIGFDTLRVRGEARTARAGRGLEPVRDRVTWPADAHAPLASSRFETGPVSADKRLTAPPAPR